MTTILGIETSCDETAAAIVRSTYGSESADEQAISAQSAAPNDFQEKIMRANNTILANVISSHIEEQKPYGGVVPEISSRAHLERIQQVIEQAFVDANITPQEIDAIAVTAGPGLIGGVIVGVMTAKAMASVLKKPIIAINHLEGHALTARLTEHTPYPYLLLLISGGHCQFIIVHALGEYSLIGETQDDAMGECFDKVAKLLGLGYPGGPAVESLARQGVVHEKLFPIPMLKHEGCDLSFSGLKTAVRTLVHSASFTHPACGGGKGGDFSAHIETSVNTDSASPPTPPQAGGGISKSDIAASFQYTATKAVSLKLARAIALFKAQYPEALHVVLAGGVAANLYIRQQLTATCREAGLELAVPPVALCTDNAVMIAWAGLERFERGLVSDMAFEPRARWPLSA